MPSVDACPEAADEADEAVDSLSSSSTSLASSALSVDCAEDTVSLERGRVERAQRLAGGHGLPGRDRDRGHLPPDLEGGAASLTGSTLPTTVSVVPMSARVTLAMR